MNEQAFWCLIDRIDRNVVTEDEDEALEPLIDDLAKLERIELGTFEEHLALTLYALDGEKYANESGESADSGDAFLYARCFVVAQGEAHYHRVLADPSLMPKSSDVWFEALLYASSTAIERNTGEAVTLETSVSWETGSNHAGWPNPPRDLSNGHGSR